MIVDGNIKKKNVNKNVQMILHSSDKRQKVKQLKGMTEDM